MVPATLVLLTVRLYASAAVGDRDLDLARREARDILDRSGVTVAWVDCRTGKGTAAVCDQPLAAREVALRFVRTADPHSAALPLGESTVEAEDRGGSLATLFPARIASLAASARVAPGIVLGRAMAHEIGHLVLGAGAHRTSGVMRPAWTGATLRLSRAPDWAFTSDQSAELRVRLSTRSSGAAEWPGIAVERTLFSAARFTPAGLSMAP